MKLSSPAFEQGKEIPEKYTCQGIDVNPPFMIEGVPAEAKCLVLIVDDPDAGENPFIHWVEYNIPPTVREIKENEAPGVSGMNDYGKIGYGGPCPPSGTHRYFFKIYALTEMLEIPEGSTYKDVEKAMRQLFVPHGQAQLFASYTKK